MVKRSIVHKDGLSLTVNLKHSDFGDVVYFDKNENKKYVLEGTPVKVKTGGDVYKNVVEVIPTKATEKADGFIIGDTELKYYNDYETGTIILQGVVYFDKVLEAIQDFKTPFAFTLAEMPTKITAVYKNRI